MGGGQDVVLVSFEHTLKYNGAYRRDVLLELGDRLDELLDANNEELWSILHRQGYYSCFDRDARANHVNATKLWVMVRIRFFAGALIGAQRARRWTWMRRLMYVVGSPLIPVVLVWRARSNIRFGAPGAATSSRHNTRHFCGGLDESDRRGLGISRVDAEPGGKRPDGQRTAQASACKLSRPMTDTLSTPRLSVVLATNSHETIRPVLSALRRQASAREIEPIIVLLGGDVTTVPLEDLSAFPHAKVVRSVNHLPEARAAGVRSRVCSNRVHRRDAFVPAARVGRGVAHRIR